MIKTAKFHHIGYAVKDINATAEKYTANGWNKSSTVLDKTQNTYICFLFKESMPLIELVAPVDNLSPVVKTLNKVGNSPYHICYSVSDMQQAINELREQKFIVLFNPVDAIALDNNKICYLFNPVVGLIELVEIK